MKLTFEYLSLAEGSLPEAEFAAWLREHIKLDADSSVDEPRVRYALKQRGQPC